MCVMCKRKTKTGAKTKYTFFVRKFFILEINENRISAKTEKKGKTTVEVNRNGS